MIAPPIKKITNNTTFEELLDNDGAVTIHQRNLRAFAIEMHKISNGLSPTFMVEMIKELDFPYYTRSSCQGEVDIDGNIADFTKRSNYQYDKVKTSRYGLKPFDGWDPKFGL